jgi:hypothetical protein
MMKSQKEVTLAEDLELRDRTDIYRNFLLYCMSGDVVALPMGASPKPQPSRANLALAVVVALKCARG